MKNKKQKLRIEFVRDITTGVASEEKLRQAVEKIAPEYHMLGMEAEYTGEANASSGRRKIMLYENPDGNLIDKPLGFQYVIDPTRSLSIYYYPSDKTFSIEEADDLELYAADCFFYLQKLRTEQALNMSETTSAQTGLPNSKGFMRDVRAFLQEGMPLSGYSSFFFNLKGFGNLNKRIGYRNADSILRYYAVQLRNYLEPDELVGHLGGDNFVALVKKDRQQAFIDYLSDVVIDPSSVDGVEEELRIGATIGIWEIDSDTPDPSDLISRASIALNQAKHIVHQKVVTASDHMITRVRSHGEVLAGFKEALAKEEFQVYYQPKVDSSTGLLVGAEGLVRWLHDGEMISPGAFIPPLEENGDIRLLDYYMLMHVCADLKKWQKEGLEPVPVSVNFSRTDLREEALAERIESIILESGIDKSLIEIEVTETVDSIEHSRLADFINRLYRMNIMTAVDDFGSGYSSLATLREFQMHTLKIDRSFVNSDDFSWRDEIILRDVIHMADELGMDYITEGVERADQLAFVNSVGCTKIQGYYYDRPLPKEEFENRLRNKQYP